MCLNQLKLNPKLAVALSREHVRNIQRSLNSQFYCFEKPEIIHSYAFKLFVRESFSYTNELNEFIGSATESGLIEKWHSDTKKRWQFTNEHEERMSGLITMDNFLGVFLLWAVLLAYQIFVLLLEIAIHRQARQSNPKFRRFWIFLDKIIDPERHFMLENKLC